MCYTDSSISIWLRLDHTYVHNKGTVLHVLQILSSLNRLLKSGAVLVLFALCPVFLFCPALCFSFVPLSSFVPSSILYPPSFVPLSPLVLSSVPCLSFSVLPPASITPSLALCNIFVCLVKL